MKIRIYCEPSQVNDALVAASAGFRLDRVEQIRATRNAARPGEVSVTVRAEIRRPEPS